MFKRRFKQCGQALVLYALLIPLLILFVGVGLDLGWYFLTVSRMQHAADAAVVAGAAKLLTNKEEPFFQTTLQLNLSARCRTI